MGAGLADGLRLVPQTGPALPVPDHSQASTDGRPRAGRTRGQPSAAVIDSQSVQGVACKKQRLRRGKEDRRAQAPHRPINGRLLMVNLTTADISDSACAGRSWTASENAGRGSRTCSPMAPTTG